MTSSTLAWLRVVKFVPDAPVSVNASANATSTPLETVLTTPLASESTNLTVARCFSGVYRTSTV